MTRGLMHKRSERIRDCSENSNLFKRVNVVFILLMAITSLCLGADNNLVMNGALDSEQSDFPAFWYTETTGTTSYERSGGPGGKGAIVLQGNANLRQQGMELVEGEKYRLSAWIKTRNFKYRIFMFLVHNAGWRQEAGFRSVPRNTGKWIKLETTITMMHSSNGVYGVAVNIADTEGEVRIADIKLVPLTLKAKALSKNPIATPTRLIIPLTPRLNYIPLSRPYLAFSTGKIPPPGEVYLCRYRVDDGAEKSCDVKPNGVFAVDLHNISAGDHKLKTVLAERNSGKNVAEENFTITMIASPEMKTGQCQKRNNLVTELLCFDKPFDGESEFYASHEGWIHLQSDSGGKIRLDGKELPQLPEMFRYVKAGRHTVDIEVGKPGHLEVVSVPEILTYQTFFPNLEFAEKYTWRNVTTINQALGAKVPANYNKYGAIIISNLGIFSPPRTMDSMQDKMDKACLKYGDDVDGVAIDECFFHAPKIIGEYSRYLRERKLPENKLVYTWVVGKPTTILHTDFMSSAINVCRGRGRLLFESYCTLQASEKEQQVYLNDILCVTMSKLKRSFPEAETSTNMILGIFSHFGRNSLNSRPDVDFKYALDMEMNILANNPEFVNLRGTGFWGFNYADEEIARWAYRLIRHYAIEGKTEMLSDHFGFKYKPGLLKNGDFVDGLDHWQKKGAVTVEEYPGLYSTIQKRWAGSVGHAFALFTKKDDQTDFLRQTVSGLTPGKLYALGYVVSDLNEIRNEKLVKRKYGIGLNISGADVVPSVEPWPFAETFKTPYMNVRKIVFRAKSPTATIVFNNEKARDNEELILSFVQMTPYFVQE